VELLDKSRNVCREDVGGFPRGGDSELFDLVLCCPFCRRLRRLYLSNDQNVLPVVSGDGASAFCLSSPWRRRIEVLGAKLQSSSEGKIETVTRRGKQRALPGPVNMSKRATGNVKVCLPVRGVDDGVCCLLLLLLSESEQDVLDGDP
jgi:hypothetical protein